MSSMADSSRQTGISRDENYSRGYRRAERKSVCFAVRDIREEREYKGNKANRIPVPKDGQGKKKALVKKKKATDQ